MDHSEQEPSSPTSSNRLLSALVSAEPGLKSRIGWVDLRVGQILVESRKNTSYAYFPVTAVVSLLTAMRDGTEMESATVGREGFVSIAIALSGTLYNARRTVVHVPGLARRISSAMLYDALQRHPDVRQRFLRYTEALLFQVMQSGACNQLHSAEQRCVRSLLMTHDRVGADTFLLTQRYLAVMLAVRRATVSGVASGLQRRGLITYRRGRITVQDRLGLESAACECYEQIRGEYERSLRL